MLNEELSLDECAQGYRKEGPKRRYLLGIAAPLLPHFIEACERLKIAVALQYIEGGTSGLSWYEWIMTGGVGIWICFSDRAQITFKTPF